MHILKLLPFIGKGITIWCIFMIFFLKIPLSSIISNILGQNDEKLHTFHGDFDEAGNVLDWLGVDCVDDGYVVLHDAVDCLQQIDR